MDQTKQDLSRPSISRQQIESKIGIIEEGKTLKLNTLTIPEIEFLIDTDYVTKNQKKRLLKKKKVNLK